MSLSAKQIKHLNNMNRAADDVSLGTMLGNMNAGQFQPTAGSVSASVAQMSASAITIATALTTIHGFTFTAVRQPAGAGSPLANTTFRTLVSSGSLTISGSGAGSIGVGDLFYYTCF